MKHLSTMDSRSLPDWNFPQPDCQRRAKNEASSNRGISMLKVRIILAAAVLCAAASALQSASAQPAPRDGQHDFDWEVGTWTTKVRVVRNPLTGKPPEWAEFQGTSVV